MQPLLFFKFEILFRILDLLSELKKEYIFSTNKECVEIHKCIDYLERNYARQIQLYDIAALVHMTPSYFCTYFKQHTGYTPFEQLHQIRINQATLLLRDKSKKITTVAIECGYNSISFFNRKFNQIMNMSPREYRKNLYC